MKGDYIVMKEEIVKKIENMLDEGCSYEELYTALLGIVEAQSKKKVMPVKGRKLYYISAEFLIGKLLSNNLINLGIYDVA